MSTAQLLVKANLSLERPPIVKKNLQWAPHGNPTDDCKAFACDGKAGISAEISDGICRAQAQRDKDKTDNKAHTALPQKMFQGTACTFSFVGKVVVDRTNQHFAWIAIWRPLFNMDGYIEATTRRKSRRPCFDKGFSFRIKVFVQERRRVHRVEQLRNLAHS